MVTAVSIAVLSWFAIPPASADECPPLDVTCVVDDVVDGGEAVADDPVGTVTDTVTSVVEDRVDQVNQLLGGGSQPPPGGGGNGGGGGIGGGGGSGTSDAAIDARRSGGTGFRGQGPSANILTTTHPIPDQRSLPERLATAAAGAVESLAVVFVLLGVAVGFVLIQDRLDKRDPRLALAPIQSDVVRFA
jgi:hypothetical protein